MRMDRNKVEIKLLQKDPESLILDYQGLIRTIVRSLVASGRVRKADQQDLMQEVNKKLLERLARIRDQYNHSSKLRTYFSVIIRNICMEEIRKPGLVAEPDPDPYLAAEVYEHPKDLLAISQEYERLMRVLTLMGQDGAWLNVMMRVLADSPLQEKDVLAFTDYLNRREKLNGHLTALNLLSGLSKKEKYNRLAAILQDLGGKAIPPESLRKWDTSRMETCLELMNGDPPRSGFNQETLAILIEKMSTQ